MRWFAFPLFVVLIAAAHAQEIPNPCSKALPVPTQMRLPAQLPPGEPVKFEKQVLAYLNTLGYRKLGWCKDKWVRDTGPLMNGVSATVHPPVHIYYSPEVSNWLLHGRQGDIPDGAVIIKEQFAPGPAAHYRDIPIDGLGCSNDWTIMIRNSKASRDGWFWAELWNGSKPSNSMNFSNEFQYPNAGYGLYCLRCHASAEKNLTFSSLSNIEGAPGWPLQFRVDNSWRDASAEEPPKTCGFGHTLIDYLQKPNLSLVDDKALPNEQLIQPSRFPSHQQNAAIQEDMRGLFLKGVTKPPSIERFPPETFDDVLARPASNPHDATSPNFVTSSQCLGCHSGLTNVSLGPSMILPSKTSSTINVSPYGEWRWSPMGLAGRDPVFYSQLDSELAAQREPAKKQLIIDTCMTCHGAMGKRTFAAEHPNQAFKVDFVYETDPAHEGFKYGGLARDGISCEVCHRMAAPKEPTLSYFLDHQINGVFNLTPSDELNGPFKDDVVTTYPMDTGLGVKPKHNAYLQSPQMCGTCHTILLPVLDSMDSNKKSVEQATYPEWLNSQYRNEYGSVGATPKTCQECHMPSGYVNDRTHVNVAKITDRIAIVQDLTYPVTDHLATPDQLNVRYREDGYKRHELLGTNGFLLQMFLQPVNKENNNETLGVRLADYMTGLATDLNAASNNLVQQAQSITATAAISKWEVRADKLIVEVTVTNKAGHRFPSGVGFRRAFLELQATANGKPFFSSGATNEKGQLTNFSGQVLPTESFVGGAYQPHFSQSNPIRNSDQVQIYEELTQDVEHKFTTSFTRRDYDIKDNRLLPIGWSLHGPADLHMPEPYLHATQPVGDALEDPAYLAGKGQSIVRYEIPIPTGTDPKSLNVTVNLYSQTIPPYFLADRDRTKTAATARLNYLTSSLGTLANTDYANWKLLIASTKR
ncbi:cytochrome P460 family protein [Granulicella sp. dw_53]|uniref:cytochrome P460 family protein n=1 Tax=Granulicella sp. dw_53 TaxID=2719792 RepID=UPI001BD4D907|nr:cytochrome P460 family protein [Granulicella sp. dw_53]